MAVAADKIECICDRRGRRTSLGDCLVGNHTDSGHTEHHQGGKGERERLYDTVMIFFHCRHPAAVMASLLVVTVA